MEFTKPTPLPKQPTPPTFKPTPFVSSLSKSKAQRRTFSKLFPEVGAQPDQENFVKPPFLLVDFPVDTGKKPLDIAVIGDDQEMKLQNFSKLFEGSGYTTPFIAAALETRNIKARADMAPGEKLDLALSELARWASHVRAEFKKDYSFLISSESVKALTNKSKESHSILCLQTWFHEHQEREQYVQRQGSRQIFAFKSAEGVGEVDGEKISFRTYKCCKDIWCLDFSILKFSKTVFYKLGLEVAHFIDQKYHDILAEKRFDRAISKFEVFKNCKENGWALFDPFVAPATNLGMSYPDYISKYVSPLLSRILKFYSHLNRHGSMAPFFRPITNKIGEGDVEDLDPGENPLKISCRLQLYVSIETIQKFLPGFYESLISLMGARQLVFSIIYNEGINSLKFHNEFISELNKLKVKMPEDILNKKILRDLVGEKRAKFWISRLHQTAHKDVTRGFFTDHAPEYIPTQALIALDQDSPTKLDLWLSDKGKGLLSLHRNHFEWEEKEPNMGFNKRKIAIERFKGLLFDGRQTHAGRGSESNFRLFVGSVCTPPEFSLNSYSQSYYTLENQGEIKEDHELFDTHLVLGEEIHADEELPPGKKHDDWFILS